MELEALLQLNKEGFFPGPKESLEKFKKRVDLTKSLYKDPINFFSFHKKEKPFSLEKKLKNPDLSWAKASTVNLFDISPYNFSAFFSDHKLRFFQGAATWILDIENLPIPLLQLREKLERKAYLKIYELEDILAHEVVHFFRAGFREPKYEEFFAYMTSSKFIRRIFGPIVISSWEVSLFIIFLVFTLSTQYLSYFFQHKVIDIIFVVFGYLAYKMLFVGFFRLAFRRWVFNRCFKKLKRFLKDKKTAMHVMVRLSDEEIKSFSKMKIEKIQKYVLSKKETSLRWKIIYEAYFK